MHRWRCPQAASGTLARMSDSPTAGPAVAAPDAVLYPLLLPEVALTWRDATTLQAGIDPSHAVALRRSSTREERALRALDGTRSLPRVLDDHVAAGGDRAWLAAAVAALERVGAIVSGGPLRLSPPPAAETPESAERDRLAPDRAVASSARLGPPVSDPLAHRADGIVLVRGTGRVGAGVATLLAAAGVGSVRVRPIAGDRQRVRPREVTPLGLPPSSVGGEAASAVRATVASTGFMPHRPRADPPHVVVLCPPRALSPEAADRLTAAGIPHLVALSDGPLARVGPLVIPGVTPCLHCLDLHRADRDPRWPFVLAQLTARRDVAPPATDTVLAALTSALAATHVLALLDGPAGTRPPSAGALLDLRLPALEWTRRSWAVHPDCGCAWPISDDRSLDRAPRAGAKTSR